MNIAQKVSVFGVILIRIFAHSDCLRRDTEYLSVFSPNAGKYRPEQFQIRTLFTQWKYYVKDFFSKKDQVYSLLQIWSYLLKKPLTALLL